jgi:hypothetical protein
MEQEPHRDPNGLPPRGQLNDAHDLDACSVELLSNDKQKWAGPREEGALARADTHRFDKALGCARGHHSGQSPSGERRKIFIGTWREDEVLAVDEPGLPILRDSELPGREHPPGGGTQQQVHALAVLGKAA